MTEMLETPHGAQDAPQARDLVVANGEVTEIGTHEELAQKSGGL